MHTFTVYIDPGHGWVKVPLAHVHDLNIQKSITPFSYIKGAHVYLEEDCDAATFIEAYKAKYNSPPTFIEKYSNRSSRIRSYDHYSTI